MPHRNFRLFVAVSLVSGFGSTAMSLTAGVWVMSLTGDAGLAGLAGLFIYLPSLVGPVLGVVVDRLPRRRVLIGTNLAMGGLLLVLLAVRSGGDIWILYAVMLGYGVSYVLLDAAESAVLPGAVPGTDLAGLNGARISAQEGTKLVAPLAGAGLFALAGGPAVALMSAGLLMVSAVLYSRVRFGVVGAQPPASGASPAASRAGCDVVGDGSCRAEVVDDRSSRSDVVGDGSSRAEVVDDLSFRSDVVGDGSCRAEVVDDRSSRSDLVGDGSSRAEVVDDVARVGVDVEGAPAAGGVWIRLWTDVVDGVRAIGAHPPVAALTVAAAATIALSGVATPAMFAVVDEGLHRPAAFLGVLVAIQGAGSIVSGLVAGRLITARGELFVVASGALLSALGTVLRAVPHLPTAVAGAVLTGIGLPWTVVAVVTALQRRIPAALLGRAAASANSLMFVPTALAIPLGALALQVTGYQVILIGVAALMAAVGVSLRRARR